MMWKIKKRMAISAKKDNEIRKNKEAIKNVYGYFLKSAWKISKGFFAVALFKVAFVAAVLPFIPIIMMPKIIDELMGGKDFNKLMYYAVTMVLLEFVLNILNGTLFNVIERYHLKFENHYKMVLSERIMRLEFQKTEDKAALDELERAKDGIGWHSGGFAGLMEPFFNIISRIITLFGVTYIVVSKAPVLLIVIAAMLVCSFFINERINSIEREEYAKISGLSRILAYFGWGIADFRYGKDIRLYDSKDMMIGKWSDYTRKLNGEWENMADRQLPLRLISLITFIVRDGATYFYLGFLALIGKISIATCTQMISSESVFSGCLEGLLSDFQTMVKRANYANEFVKFLDSQEAAQSGTKDVGAGEHTFEFRNVSFSYPGSGTKVLKNMNLVINAGEHLSVVGLNGAGKTTMIKLLCRLYDPTEGSILMDGTDIREYDYEKYMGVFSPVFQDFRLFSFSIKENLLLKDVTSGGANMRKSGAGKSSADGSGAGVGELSTDKSGVGESDADEIIVSDTLRKVGIYDKVSSFKNGSGTVLYKWFDEDGIEPSGGEQQKLAIARALIKDAPVVVLDEPTAALDPVAEYEIYRQFEGLVAGKTAIYISHRLSSCQFCDRIAVFADGTVAEYGTHAELAAVDGGLYAGMFMAQAQYYVGAEKYS